MKSTQTASVTIKTDTTAADLVKWLGKRPPNAKVSFSHTPGDRPFDGGEDRLTARWEEEES